jgi:RNA polymerase sigma factor (sigma-70 family)
MVVATGDLRLPRVLRRSSGAEVDRLYRRYADEVLRYSLMVLRSRADAEDIVQTVFVRALRALERGERVEKPRNWLIKIAHNECRRLLSSRKLHAELPDEIAVEPAERGQADELVGALEALPEHQRQALVMRELEGRTYNEIADHLSLSVSAVETLLFRARRALREQLEGALGCDEFALMLDDPDADRARLRAHARICEPCAHLERQARGRKSALRRIASALFPWWGGGGAKMAAVALTTAAVATVGGGVGVAVADKPHHLLHPFGLGATRTVLVPGKVIVTRTHVTAQPSPVVAPPRKVSDTGTVSDTKRLAARGGTLVLPRHQSDPDPQPQPIPPGDDPLPVPEPTQPGPPPVPAPPTHEAPAAGPVAAAATTPVTTAVTNTVAAAPVTAAPPTVTAPAPTATVDTSTGSATVSATTPTATVPSVTTPAATTPSVTTPTVSATITTPSLPIPPPLPLPKVNGP